MTPAERKLRAQIAAHARWSRTADRETPARKAYEGLIAKFEREIDESYPDITPDLRAKLVENRRKEHYKRLAAAALKARAKKA